MNFENYVDAQLEVNMQEKLTEKIGDLVMDRSVDLEELCNHSTKVLQHLYRLMVENTGLEMKAVDEMAIYFTHLKCGHEFCLPWVNVVDDVTQMIKHNNMTVKCEICYEEQAYNEMNAKRKKFMSGMKRDVPNIKQSDMEKAEKLEFVFLQPMDTIPEAKKSQVVKLAARINVRLNAYKAACKEGKLNQVQNAGKALKNGVNFMRRELKVQCAVKAQTPEGN